MTAIGVGQSVETLNGERGVVYDIVTKNDGTWTIGVLLFPSELTRYYSTDELVFVQ